MAPNDPKDRRNTPRGGVVVPRDFMDLDPEDELTPIRAISRLSDKLDDHAKDDVRAIAGVHESIKALDSRLTSQVTGLDTRLSQKIADVGSVQVKLLTETAGQTVLLKTAQEKWDEDRRARADSVAREAATAAAERDRKRAEDDKARELADKKADAKMDRRSKLMLAVVAILGSIITGVVVHAMERGSSSPPVIHMPVTAGHAEP